MRFFFLVFVTVFTLAMLKVFGAITVGWLVVFAPAWGPVLAVAAFYLFCYLVDLVVMILKSPFEMWTNHKNRKRRGF